MRRFSFSFQQETPTSLQIDATDVLVNDHDESLLRGSNREDFMPCRHLISFSMEKDGGRRRRRVRKKILKVVNFGDIAGGVGGRSEVRN